MKFTNNMQCNKAASVSETNTIAIMLRGIDISVQLSFWYARNVRMPLNIDRLGQLDTYLKAKTPVIKVTESLLQYC